MRLHEHLGTGLTEMSPRLVEIKENPYQIPEKILYPVLNRGIGVEIEVEGLQGVYHPAPRGWLRVEDGSLREGGGEFITKFGTRLYQMPQQLQILKGFLKRETLIFSERTSVHVHLDVRYFRPENLESFLIIYTLFERSLFDLAGSHRMSNVFCVPLRYSTTLDRQDDRGMIRFLEKLKENFKYCALNLVAVPTKGTVEFRHMEGNLNENRLMEWFYILALMLQYARSVKPEVIKKRVNNLVNSSGVLDLSREIFHGLAFKIPINNEDISYAIYDSKLFFGWN